MTRNGAFFFLFCSQNISKLKRSERMIINRGFLPTFNSTHFKSTFQCKAERHHPFSLPTPIISSLVFLFI